MPASDHETSAEALQPVAAAVNMDHLSYETYFRRVNELISRMGANWSQEQRVRTLKVAIQLAKLLADARQARLYAKKHRLITGALGEFGRLVYERVHSIAQPEPERGAAKASKEEAALFQLELAKDISRNWFLKVASIRELAPRFYIELALLGAHDILFASASVATTAGAGPAAPLVRQFYLQALLRLTKLAWGFGDPIVALHARAYLCQVADRLLADHTAVERRPDDTDAQPQLLVGKTILENLACCAKLVRCLDLNSVLDRETGTSPGSSLAFELVSNPIASILSLLTSRLEDATHSGRHGRAAQISRELAVCLDELIASLASGEQSDAALRRNAILSGICSALPSDIALARSQRMMEELRAGFEKWCQLDCNTAAASPDPKAGRLKQATISSFYASLTNLLLSIEGEDQSGRSGRAFDPVRLLSSAELIFNRLTSLHHQDEGHRAAALASLEHLRCLKACLTFANHCMDEAAVDRLLRGYQAQFCGPANQALLFSRPQAIHLLDIIKTLFTSRTSLAEFERLLTLASFNRLFGCLRKDEHKLDAAKWILDSLQANVRLGRAREGPAPDTVAITERPMIGALLKMLSVVNETMSPLAGRDEIDELSRLVQFYLDLVRIEDVHERLEFYVRCRSCVENLRPVLEQLISRVLELPEAHQLVERKRAARQNFLNGCLAFALTTIPALQDRPTTQLDLSMRGLELALKRSSLSLADYFMRQAIATLAGLAPAETDNRQCLPGRQVERLLELLLGHQDRVDLRHKIALAELLADPVPDGCEDLLRRLKLSGCIERDDNFDNFIDNNDNQ